LNKLINKHITSSSSSHLPGLSGYLLFIVIFPHSSCYSHATSNAAPVLMGGGSSRPVRLKIIVNVYDLAGGDLNNILTSAVGGGLHHSGVQIGKKEFAFGGGGSSGTGVWTQEPRILPKTGSQEKAPFSRSHEIGEVLLSKKDLKKLLSELQRDYPLSRYDLMTCNCNHFTHDVCQRLGLQAPEYLNKMANTGESIVNFGLGLLSAFGNMLEAENQEQEQRRSGVEIEEILD